MQLCGESASRHRPQRRAASVASHAPSRFCAFDAARRSRVQPCYLRTSPISIVSPILLRPALDEVLSRVWYEIAPRASRSRARLGPSSRLDLFPFTGISGHGLCHVTHGITRRGPRSGTRARRLRTPGAASALVARRRPVCVPVSRYDARRSPTLRRTGYNVKCSRYVAAPNLASSTLPLPGHQRSLRTHYYQSLRHACLHVFLAHERVPVLHFSSPLHWQLGAGNGRGRCRLPDWWPYLSERGVRCVPV